MSAPAVLMQLQALADPDYRAFHCRLIPTVPPERVLGVRTPALRRYARQLAGTPQAEVFLKALPHRYYDENNLHAFLLSLGHHSHIPAALEAGRHVVLHRRRRGDGAENHTAVSVRKAESISLSIAIRKRNRRE